LPGYGLGAAGMAGVTEESSPLDVIMAQRVQRNEGNEGGALFPPALTRRYRVYINAVSTAKPLSVRLVKSEMVGSLVTVKGLITRVTNVKPQIVVAAYSCDKCGDEVFQEVTSHTWTQLTTCPSDSCKRNKTNGSLVMQTRASKFIKFQEVKIQELMDQVPMGHIPRSMSVYMTQDLCRSVKPGDIASITGIFLPIPFTGFKAIKAGLITDTYLFGQVVQQMKVQYNEMVLTPEIQAEIQALAQDSDLYNKLASSIAPEIYGHEDIKKALLLLLVGGPTHQTGDGMKVRGDLNICLMGDPGVAKSQLLKYISKIAPRGVYTTGRGSSGVGLTACVMRDPVTEEMVLEGGALVLADNGIACIDEFDKMEETDRTAIHEVMEQQTISISKAGITTTLNARASILAAANPQFGRYNTKKKATENINLPAALLSRFDLLFLILDRANLEDDLRLAQHVTYVHMHLTHPRGEMNVEPIGMNVMRHYISIARTFTPTLPDEVGDYLVNAYVHLRSKSDEMADLQYTCARSLLSLIRMSSALARLRFSETIEIGDVDEALRLVDVSKSSLTDGELRNGRGYVDVKSAIFEIVKSMSKRLGGTGMDSTIPLSQVRDRVISKGYSLKDLESTLDSYEQDDVWLRVGESHLRWVRIDDEDEDL